MINVRGGKSKKLAAEIKKNMQMCGKVAAKGKCSQIFCGKLRYKNRQRCVRMKAGKEERVW